RGTCAVVTAGGTSAVVGTVLGAHLFQPLERFASCVVRLLVLDVADDPGQVPGPERHDAVTGLPREPFRPPAAGLVDGVRGIALQATHAPGFSPRRPAPRLRGARPARVFEGRAARTPPPGRADQGR